MLARNGSETPGMGLPSLGSGGSRAKGLTLKGLQCIGAVSVPSWDFNLLSL